MTGVASRQNDVALALAGGACLTTQALVGATGLHRRAVADTCCKLVSRGWLVRRERGCFALTPAALEKVAAGEQLTSGPNGPNTQFAPRRRGAETDRDRIWRAIRVMQKFSISALEEIGGAKRLNAVRFVNDLSRAGYLVPLKPEPGVAPTSPGFKRWLLIDDTGFRTPSVRLKGGQRVIIDANTGTTRELAR